MHKKFEINRTNIKGSCQLGRKLVTHNSKSDLPLVYIEFLSMNLQICSENMNTITSLFSGGENASIFF